MQRLIRAAPLVLMPFAICTLTGSLCAQVEVEPLAIIALERPAGHLVIRTSVGPLDSLQFVLDTGAERSSVTLAVARRLGIADSVMSRDTIHGLAGSAVMALADLPAVRVGQVRVEDIRAVVLDPTALHGPGSRARYDGILGQDFLRHFDVEIDLPGGRVRFFAPGSAGPATDDAGRVPSRSTDENWFAFDAMVEGIEVRGVLDTGTRRSMLNRSAAEKLGVELPGEDAAERPGGVGGHVVAAAIDVEEIRIGDVDLGPRDVLAADAPVFGTIGLDRRPAMLIGLDLLTDHSLYLSYNGRWAEFQRRDGG